MNRNQKQKNNNKKEQIKKILKDSIRDFKNDENNYNMINTIVNKITSEIEKYNTLIRETERKLLLIENKYKSGSSSRSTSKDANRRYLGM